MEGNSDNTRKEKSPTAHAIELFRDPGRIRTPNPQSRNLIFYPVELRGQRGGEITMQNAIPATFFAAMSIFLKRGGRHARKSISAGVFPRGIDGIGEGGDAPTAEV